MEKAVKDQKQLEADIKEITHSRAVCRTDCNNDNIEFFNLPRTDSCGPKKAVNFLQQTYQDLISQGAAPEDICFIMHKFIPALASAWALADPDKQIVKIDSLWGVPDGLQYYPHDSFEVNVKLKKVVAERLRYKPFFIQELKDGSWKQIQVKRSSARGVSVPRSDIVSIAEQTLLIAQDAEKPVAVMWFCDIPEEVGIGRNLPWIATEPETTVPDTAAPKRKPFLIRNAADIKRATEEVQDHILLLEPEVPLIRKDKEFLDKVIELAKDKGVPVQIQGSTLGHAYYILQREGVAVFPSDAPKYERVRGKQTFHKLVRDAIPSRISEAGEQVLQARIQKEDTRSALLVKLLEEAFELREAQTPDEVTEELADVLEVVKSLAEAAGVDWDDIMQAASSKREARGSFKDNVVLLETSLPKGEKVEITPQLVPLANLARVVNKGDGAEISFPGLLADGGTVNLVLPSGMEIQLSISSSGLLIREGSYEEGDDGEQLFLPLS